MDGSDEFHWELLVGLRIRKLHAIFLASDMDFLDRMYKTPDVPHSHASETNGN
jgi:hypothetical protein